MNTKIFIIVLIGVVVAAGLFAFIQKDSNQDITPSAEQNNSNTQEELNTENAVIITYGQEGYTPSEITIKQGDVVTFKNESQGPMWPATNIHPTHTIYPGSDVTDCSTGKVMFDSCRGIASGDSWSFQFNEKGNWKYHDHLSAFYGGTIIVE